MSAGALDIHRDLYTSCSQWMCFQSLGLHFRELWTMNSCFLTFFSMHGLECCSTLEYAVTESRSVLLDHHFWSAVQFYVAVAFFLGNGYERLYALNHGGNWDFSQGRRVVWFHCWLFFFIRNLYCNKIALGKWWKDQLNSMVNFAVVKPSVEWSSDLMTCSSQDTEVFAPSWSK